MSMEPLVHGWLVMILYMSLHYHPLETDQTPRCSLLKVLVENGQYIVNDYDTIEEMSNFVARGGSYEASPGTTDDIMMTLVIFAWAANQAYFQEICNTNFKQKYVTESYEQMMRELSPVGYFNGVEPDDGEIWNL